MSAFSREDVEALHAQLSRGADTSGLENHELVGQKKEILGQSQGPQN